MLKKLYFSLMITMAFSCHSTEYIGTIGNSSIIASFTEDNIDTYGNSYYPGVTATYMYAKYKTPLYLVKVDYVTKDTLIYAERDGKKNTAIFKLKKTKDQLTGTWESLKTGKILPVILNSYNETHGELQSASLEKHYFRLKCDTQNTEITIFDKKTNIIIQTITIKNISKNMTCYHNAITIGDVDDNGIKDFIVRHGESSDSYGYNLKNKKYEYVLPPMRF